MKNKLLGLTQNCSGKASRRRQYFSTARSHNAAGAVLRKSWLFQSLIVASACLTAGCANFPSSTTPAAAESQRLYHPRIHLAGRLSIHYQGQAQDESVHGSFSWSQQSERTTVNLLSPLGQTIATIHLTASEATLIQPGQAPRTAPHVDALVAEVLGWPLPIAGLADWLQGFTQTNSQHQPIASPDNASVVPSADFLSKDGWHIRYVSWDTSNTAAAHPKRIDLERHTATAGNVAIRIVLDTWQPQ